MKRLSIIFVLVCLSLIITSQLQAQIPPYDVLVRSAKIYMIQKDYDRAELLLDSAIASYPNAFEAHYLIGTLYKDRASYHEMMQHFNSFDSIYAKAKAEGNKKMVKNCEKDEMPQQIARYRLSAFKASFDDGVGKLKFADSLSRIEGADDSAKAYNEKNAKTLYTKSKELFEECVTICDTIAGAWTNLGLSESKLGNMEAATKDYQKAHDLAPKDADITFSLASALYRQKEYAKAADFYGLFAKEDTLNAEAALLNQAMCYQALGDNEKLKESLDAVLRVNPNNPDVAYQRGMFYIRKASDKSIADSSKVLDSLLEKSPGNKSLEKAKQDLIDYRVGLYKQALPDFQKAAEVSKTDPEYWYWYGSSAFLSDHIDQAQTAYEKCVEFSPEDKNCWRQLASIYAKLKQVDLFNKADAKCKSLGGQ